MKLGEYYRKMNFKPNEPNNEINTEKKSKEKRVRRKGKKAAATMSSSNEVEEALVVSPPTPEYGMVAIAGRARGMEDAVGVKMNLCYPEIAGFLPVHFFAVYDGHGGPHVSNLCKVQLDRLLKEELMRIAPAPTTSMKEEDGLWKQVFKRVFRRMDDIALSMCNCGANTGNGCKCNKMVASLTGTTATVVVVTHNKLIVANCGDSRAVLCRNRAHLVLPLSVDHKPDRPDELARIEAVGGRVIHLDAPRVQGVLAMSRAIGDKYLKPIVISEPEITITQRDVEDECLIIASDGLWDVIPNEMACKVAFQCLQHEQIPDDVLDIVKTLNDEDCPTQSARTAAVLTCLALGKESKDNISVIVVNLKTR